VFAKVTVVKIVNILLPNSTTYTHQQGSTNICSHITTNRCISIGYFKFHLATLHYTSLHFTTLHFTSLHFTTLHFTSLHYTSLQFTPLHFTSLHFTSLHFTSLHYTSLHFTTLHFTSSRLNFTTNQDFESHMQPHHHKPMYFNWLF